MDKIWLKSYPPGVPAEIHPAEYRSLLDIMERSLAKYRDLPAYTSMDRTLTFGDLDVLSRRFAAYLQKVAGLRRGDRLLICSDGLHGEVDDARLREILAQAFSPRRTLELMLEEALRNGGRDNITALLLALDDPALRLPAHGETPRVTDPDNPNADGKGSLLGRLGRVLGSR